MKKILNLIIVALMILTLTSCATMYAQDDIYTTTEPSVNIVVEYGIPYYTTNGLIAYYVYNGWYCYPYYVNNIYRFHYYRKPLHPREMHHYRPIPKDYRHVPNHRVGTHKPYIYHNDGLRSGRSNINNHQNRGNITPRNHGNSSGGRRFGSRK